MLQMPGSPVLISAHPEQGYHNPLLNNLKAIDFPQNLTFLVAIILS